MRFATNSYLRAATHAAVTLTLAAAVWFLPVFFVKWALLAIAVFFLAFEVARLHIREINFLFFRFFKPVLRPKEWWDSTGAAYVSWGAMAAVFCFSREIAVIALCFLAVGDATSSAIGSYFASRKRGSSALSRGAGCLIVCLICGIILYYLDINIPLSVIVAGSLAATIFENTPVVINDNVRIPFGSGLVMTLLLFVW